VPEIQEGRDSVQNRWRNWVKKKVTEGGQRPFSQLALR
jgi:hypothetical protein